MAAYGVMFHHFYDERHPQGQGAISAQDLLDLIKHVGQQDILPADEWMRRALGGTLADKDLCLTFDDALRCQYDVAFPLLRDLGLTAFWFVYSSILEGNIEPLEIYRYFRTTLFSSVDEFYEEFFNDVATLYPVEYEKSMLGFDPESHLAAFPFYTRNDRIFRYLRDDVLGSSRYHPVMQAMMVKKGVNARDIAASLWMEEEHLRTLRDAGHLIGLHSYTHPTRLGELPPDAQAHEYRRNFCHLQRVLSEDPVCMSHPCNSYSDETLPILQSLGVKIGFRANMERIVNRSRFEFPRQDHTNIMKEIRS